MSLTDMPRLPAEMIPRVRKLVDMAKAGEVEFKDIAAQLSGPALSKMMPVVMRAGGPKIAEAVPKLFPALLGKLPSMMGRRIFVRVADVGYFIVNIGVPPKLFNIAPSTFEEIKEAHLPGIYLDPELIPYFLEGGPNMMSLMGADLIRIYGVKEMMKGGSSSGYKGESIIDTIMPLMATFMSKEVLDSLQGPYEEMGEMVLSAFGV